MIKVKITSIGNSMGIILPKETLQKLNAGKGDDLYLVENSEGYMLSPYQQDFAQQVEAAKKIMKQYKNTLHELSK